MKTIDIVIPCFNEFDVLDFTFDAIYQFAKSEPDFAFRFIFVDDGSSDKTKDKLASLASLDSRVVPVILSRNFGHQIAVSAGLEASNSDAVVIIDADLQDPVDVISQMITKWSEGYDVVYGTRIKRSGESNFKLLSAKLFYRILNRLSEVPIPLDTGDFRLISRKVVEILKRMPERQRFIRGMVSWVGFRQVSVAYERSPRKAGETKYTLGKMLAFAADGVISFSNTPLRISMHLGFWASGLALISALYLIFSTLTGSVGVPGWASTITAILFLGGIQLISLGLIGEYVGRIYSEVKARPLYLTDTMDQ